MRTKLLFTMFLTCAFAGASCSRHRGDDSNNGSVDPSKSRAGNSMLSVDLNGDGRTDVVRIARQGDNNVVLTAEIRLENGHVQSQSLNFEIARDRQAAICAWPVQLVAEPLNYDPDPGVGVLPGYQKSNQAIGLRISDGECDDIHIYWNHDARRVDWWRQ